MSSPDTPFAHSGMSGYDNQFATGFSQPAPLSTYGFGLGPNTIHAPQSFMAYTTPSDMFNPAAALYAVQPPYSDYYPPVTAALTNQMASMTIGGSPAGGGGVIFTEQRGIQIRDIPRRTSSDQIRKMIREVAGSEVSLVNAIEIPSDQDGNPRGLAFVHFGSADLARRMARHLNGVEFKGRKLQVRLMKDGEAIFDSGGSGGVVSVASAGSANLSKSHRGSKHHHHHHHHHSQSSKDDRRRTERIDKSSGPGAGTGTNNTSRSSRPSSGGSDGAKPSSSSSQSLKSKGKKSCVVIADGSSSSVGRDADKR